VTRAAALALLVIPLAAQTPPEETLVWHDGTSTRGRLIEWTVHEVRYMVGSRRESRPSWRLARIDGQGVRDPQVGALETAHKQRQARDLTAALGTLAALFQKIPNSALWPLSWRWRIEDALQRDDRPAALAAIAGYREQAAKDKWPDPWLQEAALFEVVVRLEANEVDAGEARGKLRAIQAQVGGAPNPVLWRARLQLALLQQKDDPAAAERELRELVGEAATDQDLLARVWLALGQILHARGTDAAREPFHQALLAFLRVWLETPAAWPELRAEAAYFAAAAAERWQGNDWRVIHARMRGLLQRDHAGSRWAKR
jgi:hypothetical protein